MFQGVLEPGAATDLRLTAHVTGGHNSTAEVLASGALRPSCTRFRARAFVHTPAASVCCTTAALAAAAVPCPLLKIFGQQSWSAIVVVKRQTGNLG